MPGFYIFNFQIPNFKEVKGEVGAQFSASFRLRYNFDDKMSDMW